VSKPDFLTYEHTVPVAIFNEQQKVYLSWMDDAYSCAIRNLGRYKFDRFGYFSARWVTLNKLGVELGLFDKKQPNPFKDLVDLAKRIEVFERLT